MAQKFYAVHTGRNPEYICRGKHVKHRFMALQEHSTKVLRQREDGDEYRGAAKCSHVRSEAFAFVDGSFNTSTSVYGYGGFIEYKGERYELMGNGNDADMAINEKCSRGEVLGSMAAVKGDRAGNQVALIFIMIIWESRWGNR